MTNDYAHFKVPIVILFTPFSVACSSKDYLLEKAFISERRTKAREPSEVAVWVTGKALTACVFERENGKMER